METDVELMQVQNLKKYILLYSFIPYKQFLYETTTTQRHGN
jgi:hypothetical protein